MNAALKQICCCRWMGDTRVSHDINCAVHGVDDDGTRKRNRALGEALACQEAIRDIDADIAVLTKRREKIHARMIAAQKQMEQA